MTDRMQKYVNLRRAMPEKRPAKTRKKDHNEVYNDFSADEASRQASRCEQCGVPYCQIYCPVHNNIPDWLKMTAEGRLEEAYALSQATNNFPEICGRICPQDRLCEAKWACTLEQAGHGTVTIGAIERYITDNAWRESWVKPRIPRVERPEKIAIVGAGPAGMAASEELRSVGYQVHLYDQHSQMGGLMMYGIPGFKLEKHVVSRRASLLLAAGVSFHPGTRLGRDFSLNDLRSEYDTVVLAYGAYASRTLDIPGTENEGVVAALDYLIDSGRHLIGEIEERAYDATDRRVVVVGGGDTAMDCVRTAVRQGARAVTCLYRRDRANMPGSGREVGNAEEEGVSFQWNAQPEALMGIPVDVIPAQAVAVRGRGSVVAIRALRTRLSEPGADGRSIPQPIENSEFELPADLIINALGFQVEDARRLTNGIVGMTRHSTIDVDHRTMMTEAEGVFAAGDAARGPSLAVWAIRDGRDVAIQVRQFLLRRAAKAEQRGTNSASQTHVVDGSSES